MKKILTTLLILSGIYSISNAQTHNTNEFGVNVGYNEATETGTISGLLNKGYVCGFNVGVSAEHYFTDNWGIKANVNFDQKGWSNTFPGIEGLQIGKFNAHLNYLTIPVTANWHFGKSKNWYVNAGPYIGFLLGTSTNHNDIINNADLKSGINTADFGFAGGIGVKFPVSKSVKLFIEADGQSGITNILKNSDSETVRNVRSSINFGFLIPVK